MIEKLKQWIGRQKHKLSKESDEYIEIAKPKKKVQNKEPEHKFTPHAEMMAHAHVGHYDPVKDRIGAK